MSKMTTKFSTLPLFHRMMTSVALVSFISSPISSAFAANETEETVIKETDKVLNKAVQSNKPQKNTATSTNKTTSQKSGTTPNASNKTTSPSATGQNSANPTAAQQANQPPKKVVITRVPNNARFSLTVNDARAREVFLGLANGTRYNMLVHPKVVGNISISLKNTSIFEALDAIRELYGYEYKIDGQNIYIQPLTLQTRIFQINYLSGKRSGRSSVGITSSSTSNQSNSGNSNTSTSSNNTSTTSSNSNGSYIATDSENNFWVDTERFLKIIIGIEDEGNNNSNNASNTAAITPVTPPNNTNTAGANAAVPAVTTQLNASGNRETTDHRSGKSIVVSPQSGVIVIRAFPDELRNAETFLQKLQNSIERQVIIEAKIIEVILNDKHQSGINWGAFKIGPNSAISAGVMQPNTLLRPGGTSTISGTNPLGATQPMTIYNADGTTRAGIAATVPGASLNTAKDALGTLFGIAFQTSNFAALLSFLETQGTSRVLSSPRIATLNNQKAVLKIGTDDYFITGVTVNSTTVASGSGSAVTNPTYSYTIGQFFSGIALDVMPQIDDSDNITLHVHPSISKVTEKMLTLNNNPVPLASSQVTETDSVIRAQDGQIVAIGGLMRYATESGNSGVPVLKDLPVVGDLFKYQERSGEKRELVILLKPTIIRSRGSWQESIDETKKRIEILNEGADAKTKKLMAIPTP